MTDNNTAKHALSDIRFILDFKTDDKTKLQTIKAVLAQVPENQFKANTRR